MQGEALPLKTRPFSFSTTYLHLKAENPPEHLRWLNTGELASGAMYRRQ